MELFREMKKLKRGALQKFVNDLTVIDNRLHYLFVRFYHGRIGMDFTD